MADLKPVQAEQSLEVVAEVPDNGCWRIKPIAPELPIGMKFADHAKATAALAQKDAEIADQKAWRAIAERHLGEYLAEVTVLRAQLAEAEKVVAAAKNLAKVKGRFHTEQAFGHLVAALSSQQEGGRQ